jgi:hypothetical protein
VSPESVKEGKQVVVNDSDHAIIYTVAEIQGFGVRLEYECAGKLLNAGWLDVSYLQNPTSKQMKNN